MAFWNSTQILNINEGTTPNDGTGDNIRDAFTKVDENFANVSIQLGQFNQDWTNANIEYNLQANFGNISNLFVANSTGTTSNFTGNSSSANIIANAGLYSNGTSHFRSNVYVTGNILPTTYGTFNLGSAAFPFGNLYVQNTISTNQISASSDAGMLLVHANATIGAPVDVGIMGNISTVAGSNVYSFMGFQASTNSFMFATTPVNSALGNSKASAFTLSNVQVGSLRISNSTASTSTTTGALIVAGGAGIAGALYTGSNIATTGNLNATGNIYSGGYQAITTASQGFGNIYNGTNTVFVGNVVFPAATPSTGYTTGAVVVPFGGIGVYGNVVAGGFVGSVHGVQNSITSLTVGGNVTIATGQMNIRAVQATSVNTADLTATGTVSFTGVTLSGLANVTAAVVNSTGNIGVTGNINTVGNIAGAYFLGNGALLTGLATNTQFSSLSSNVTAANAAIQTISANLGSYQTWANSTIQTASANTGAYYTWANANAATQASSINLLNANLGAIQTYANLTFQSISANTGAYYAWANAAMQTDDANIGAYHTWANSTIQTTNANIGAYHTWANSTIQTTNANIGAYHTWANSTIQTASANTGAYQTWANSTIQTTNANIGAYHTWANAAMQTDDANIGAYQTWANSTIQTASANTGAYQTWANANAATQASSINLLNANIGAYETWANSNFGTSSYSNVNLIGYLAGTVYVGNFSTGNAIITSCDASTLDATTGVITNFSSSNIRVSGGYLTGLANISTNGTAGNATIGGNINLTGSIIPSANVTSNLGDSTHWFKTLYGVSTQALYADLAERYTADAEYEPGTVVVFGGDQEITVTEEFADARVAGAISTEPAYLMNAGAVGLPVALRGRVPCRVIGPVTKGDLLVTAGARAGYAVSVGSNKAYSVSVFAKALVTDLSEGEKIIEVVII